MEGEAMEDDDEEMRWPCALDVEERVWEEKEITILRVGPSIKGNF